MKLEYDAISPITGNKCVLIEADTQSNTESYICMESGFSTHEKLVQDSEFQKQYEDKCTELMLSCKFIDDDKKAWYPTFMRLPGGMLYAEGPSKDNWNWKVAKIIPLVGEERKKYPIVGQTGSYHESKLDVENANQYDNTDFQLALDELYNIVRETYNED